MIKSTSAGILLAGAIILLSAQFAGTMMVPGTLPTPEPSTMLLVGTVLVAFASLTRTRIKKD